MAEHRPTCDICNKEFKNRQGLEYHINNNVCTKFTCKYCSLRFKTSTGLRYHETNRICLPSEKIKVNVIVKTKYHKYTLPLSDIKLRDVLTETYNFGPTVFGSSNIIVKFCEVALTNDNLDQYWSMYINNKREQFIHVYNEDKWSIKPQTVIFKELTTWALGMLKKYLDDNKSFIEYTEYYSKYRFTTDHLEKERNQIHRDIKQGLFCLFVNHKSKLKEKSEVTGISLKLS